MSFHALFLFGSQACVPEDPLRAAKRMGGSTTVLAAKLPCGLSGDLVDRFEKADPSRYDRVVETVRALHERNPVHAVLAYDDRAVPAAARAASALGLPGNPPEAADAASDKFLMKQSFQRAGVPIAAYRLAQDEEDAVAWAASQGYPVVVKPVHGSASQGVIRADSEAELRQAYRRLRRIVLQSALDFADYPDSVQLVESYLPGDEISVELLVADGRCQRLCVFDKPEPLTGPFFEETIYRTPSLLPVSRQREFVELARRAVQALGLRNGPAHCEIRFSDSQAWVLEVGARLIGGSCSRVFRHILQEDIHEVALKLALGRSVEPPSRSANSAGAMMLPIPTEGRVQGIRGVEAARAVPGVQDVAMNVACGDVVVPFPEQSCYIGFLTASADRPLAVDAALSEAAKRIQLDLEPIACQWWTRPLEGSDRLVPAGVESLQGLSLEEARPRVLPLVARCCFPELPREEALEAAAENLECLLDGYRGETSTDLWLLAADQGIVLGSRSGDTGHATCLGVAPRSRRSGVATALLHALMLRARELGCRKFAVLVDPRHPPSVNFFRRLGFLPAPEERQACCDC